MSTANKHAELGQSIPYMNPHALSVSLPTWEDNVGWASGDSRIVDKMKIGYPRFFVHRTIQALANVCLERNHITDRLGMLFPTALIAQECVTYMTRYIDDALESANLSAIRIDLEPTVHKFELYLVVFPTQRWKLAKAFWQHGGLGISSRYAEMCFALLPKSPPQQGLDPRIGREYSVQNTEHQKLILRRRIASLVARGECSAEVEHRMLNGDTLSLGFPTEDDVYLYPTGMSAIWHSHQLTLSLMPGLKSVCFGFPYTDTIKVLERWGPGCHFYGEHPDINLSALEELLRSSRDRQDTSGHTPPISAVFCECPSNPLLQTPNLPRLRELADEHGFMIIIDETVGNFVNVNVLQYVDVVTTSLSKLFNGNADAMGGSMVLNPKSPHYAALKGVLQSSYVDDYFSPDAIQMEANSRDFAARVDVINANTQGVCNFLRARSLAFAGSSAESTSFAIKEVFYPEWVTRENYDLSRRPGKDDNFGPLFSLTFVSDSASAAFFDTLPCAKGPSLGTNFTLACPYTILAHFWELPWAAEFGVEEGIVRVSVGMEDRTTLMDWFTRALVAAEATILARVT